MNQVLLASHGKMAEGLKDTAEMILGPSENLQAFGAYRDEEGNILDLLESAVKKIPESDTVFILTDIFGGSVNNSALALIQKHPDIQLIAGMNLPLVIALLSGGGGNDELLAAVLNESRDGIVNCSALLKNTSKREEDEI